MKKEPFEELILSGNDRIPYSGGTVCFCMTQYAKNYVKAKENSEAVIAKDIRDAVIVDSINYMGLSCGMDFGLYTCDLYDDEKYDEMVEPNTLLTVILNHYSSYIEYGIPASITRNNHMNNLQEKQKVSDIDCVSTLANFMNYIASANNIDKVFSAEELIQRKQILKDRENELKISKKKK